MPAARTLRTPYSRARRRRQPVGDLPLEHHRGVGQRQPVVDQLDQLEQDRRGDVVGQVARDAPRSGASTRRRQFLADPFRRVASRKSPSTTSTLGGGVAQAAARSRSISIATTAAARGEGEVSAPRPGPISRMTRCAAVDARRPCRPRPLEKVLPESFARLTAARCVASRLESRHFSSISSISSSLSPK